LVSRREFMPTINRRVSELLKVNQRKGGVESEVNQREGVTESEPHDYEERERERERAALRRLERESRAE